ncbi:MAG: radical SAM protein [Deltaproteobacteria bacterium]|nr:radical SAM protein [Deltaproteobacteria bacterium]
MTRPYRVMLVYPRTRSITVNPPLGVAYLAASLRKLPGVEVAIHDCEKRREPPARSAERIAEWKPDLVGVSLSTPTYLAGREVIRHLQSQTNPPVIAVGGPHVSALPEASVANLRAHFGFIGESEITFPKLVERLRDAGLSTLEPGAHSPVDVSDIAGVAYRNGEPGLSRQARGAWNDDLDALPWPAFDLMGLDEYPPHPHQLLYRSFPIAPIMTARGCPYECTFCASPELTGRTMRYRSPVSVVDEMEYHHRRFGVREFHIEDDVFNILRSHVVGVCEEILRRGLQIEWKCPNGVRIDRLDPELVKLMKRSGCYQLSLGIETGDEDVLDRIKKKFTLARNEGVVDALRREGIEVLGLFILGFPGESKKSVRSTIDYALTKPFNLAHFSVFSYLPGSAEAERHFGGRADEALVEEVARDACYYTPVGNGIMSGRELKSLQRLAVLRFYLRPKQFFFFLKRLRARQLVSTANILVKYLYG